MDERFIFFEHKVLHLTCFVTLLLMISHPSSGWGQTWSTETLSPGMDTSGIHHLTRGNVIGQIINPFNPNHQRNSSGQTTNSHPFFHPSNATVLTPGQPFRERLFSEIIGDRPNAFIASPTANGLDIQSGPPIFNLTAVPANNTCENAQVIHQSTDFNCNNPISGTTLGATTDHPADVTICQPFDSIDFFVSITNEVWYKFTPTHSNFVIAVYNLQGIGGSEPTQAVLSIFEGTCGGGLQTLSCGGTAPGAFFTATPGSTYYLSVSIVDDNGTAVPANFDLCLFRETSFQSNNECDNATSMAVSPTISCTNKKSGFTSLADEYAGATFNFTPSASGYFTIEVNNFVGRYGNIMPSPDFATFPLVFFSYSSGGNNCRPSEGDQAEILAQNVTAPLILYVTAGIRYNIGVTPGNSRFGIRIPSTFDICVRPVTPPVNDECAGAIPVNASTTASCENKVQASTQLANNSTQSGQKGDVWFSYTSSSTERITISADNFGAVSNLLHIPRKAAYIDLYTGSCGNLTPVASGHAPLSVDVGAGTYYAKVRTLADASTDLPATFDFCIRTCAAPPNDVCANTSPAMQVITESTDFNCTPTNGSTTCAIRTLSSNFTEVWYSFTPSSTGFYGFEAMSSSSQDCALVLYEACNDIVPIGYAISPAGTNLTAGTEYKLAVGTFDGNLGISTQEDFSICIYYDPALPDCDGDVITIQPVQYNGTFIQRASQTIMTNGSVVVEAGAEVTFTADQSITLSPGFQAQDNSMFTALIAPCSSPSVTVLEGRVEDKNLISIIGHFFK